MANKYTRKSKLKTTDDADEFVSFWHRVYDAVRPYDRPIVFGMAAVLLVLVGIWTTDHFVTSRRQHASEGLGRVLRIYEAELLAGDPPQDKKDEEIPRFKTAKERSEAVIAEIDKLGKDSGSAGAAKRALVLRASALFDLGRYEEAETAYRKFADELDKNDAFVALAREAMAASLEARGKLDAALGIYRELEKGPSFLRDLALFDQARVLGLQGDKKKAREVYKQILDKSPTTPLREEIEARQANLAT